MEFIHTLLSRQLKKQFGDDFIVPAAWQQFIEAVNTAYLQFDSDRGMLERSLDLSSLELLEANSEMRSIIHAFPDLLFRIDLHGQIIDYKAGRKAELFVPRENLIGKRIQDTPSKRVSIKFQNALDKVQKKKGIVSIEYSILKRGHKYFFEARLLPLPEHQIMVIIRNITDRKRAEEELRESEQRFRAITGTATDAIVLMDDKGYISYWNPAAEKIFGYSKKETIGKELHAFLAPAEYYESFKSGFDHFQSTGQGTAIGKTVEFLAIRKDRTQFPIEVSTSAIKMKGRWHSVGIIRDITDRKRTEEELRQYRDHLEELVKERTAELQREIAERTHAEEELEKYRDHLEELVKERTAELRYEIAERRQVEEALKSSEGKYRTLVENINIGVYRATGDLHGPFMQANKAMINMFGYDSKDEFMTLSLSDLFIYPEERQRFFSQTLKNGSVKDREISMQKKDGSPLWTSCTANIQYDEKGNIQWIDGVVEDITERKKIEDQLRQAQKMEAIGTLAGGVAHDFNNILTAIIGYGNLLKEEVMGNDLSGNYVDQILTAADKAAFLTRSLLAFGRKQIINLKPVSINDIVRTLGTLLLRVIGEDISLITTLSEEHIFVMADAGQIEQVLMNLAANARDAMPDGGRLTIETGTIHLDNEFISAHGFGKVGSYALITVEDTGQGMDEKTRERIFEPFYTTKEVGKGTGLGLAMAYGIVKQHDGFLTVYSEPGAGTSFKIYLPVIPSEFEEAEPPAASFPPKGGTETVLIAEDNAEVRKFMRYILEKSGYTVMESSDGEDAMDQFLKHSDIIQLLIFDVIMPHKSGKEVYEEIKKIRPDIRVLFTSGYTADIIHRKGVLEKGVNFISKPVSPDKFLRKVREALEK